ncbi:hypothetical protein [Mucilaginibacter auburnensis]|uniref:Uncharacterized protein n=1 Tax=Mucilaginibacter auburnensis TaxID=1457233 RepID=A0A2H9VLT7_9SPHI|nr:hypothetical protein [Mucilaginibacter auburnensis]PJJ79272.1 hypothetical protein CLV57_2401 [Mucilaginibacter auburnensis]
MTEQLALFGEAGQSRGLPTDFLEYFTGLFSPEEGNDFFKSSSQLHPGSRPN